MYHALSNDTRGGVAGLRTRLVPTGGLPLLLLAIWINRVVTGAHQRRTSTFAVKAAQVFTVGALHALLTVVCVVLVTGETREVFSAGTHQYTEVFSRHT